MGSRLWTVEEKAYVRREWYKLTPLEVMAEHLGRTPRAVQQEVYVRLRLSSRQVKMRQKPKPFRKKSCSYKDALPPEKWPQAQEFFRVIGYIKRFYALTDKRPNNLLEAILQAMNCEQESIKYNFLIPSRAKAHGMRYS